MLKWKPKWVEILYAFPRIFPKIKNLVKITAFYLIRNHKQKWKNLGVKMIEPFVFTFSIYRIWIIQSFKLERKTLIKQRLIWSTVLTLMGMPMSPAMGTKEMLRLYHRLGSLALVDLQSYKSVVVFCRVRVPKIK